MKAILTAILIDHAMEVCIRSDSAQQKIKHQVPVLTESGHREARKTSGANTLFDVFLFFVEQKAVIKQCLLILFLRSYFDNKSKFRVYTRTQLNLSQSNMNHLNKPLNCYFRFLPFIGHIKIYGF